MNKTLLALIVATLPLAALAEPPVQNLLSTYHQARESDPVWASAQNANLAAQEKLVQGKALLLPTATLGANAGHTHTDLERTGGITNIGRSGYDDYETYGYSLNINQPLYRKQNSIQYEQSKIQVAQAGEQLNTANQELMLRVSQAYFDVLLAQDKIDLIAAQKSAISRQLEQAKANFEVGSSTITDVHEAQARFDLTLAQEIAAVNELEAKKHAIQAVTGQMPQRLATARNDLHAAIPEPVEMEKWVEIAEQNNLALKIQRQSLQLASQEVERTRAGHLPTLDVVGSYNDTRANGGTSSDLVGYNRGMKAATVGLQLEIPLYQGGAISSRAREAVANQQKTQDDVEAARRQADLQTRQAFLNVTSSVAQVKAYEQALVSSQSQLDSTTLGYDVGVRTSVDVLNAQQQFYSAKRDLLQARYSWLLSVLQLKAAAGVLSETDLAATNSLLEGS
jgi:outer membrane protein